MWFPPTIHHPDDPYGRVEVMLMTDREAAKLEGIAFDDHTGELARFTLSRANNSGALRYYLGTVTHQPHDGDDQLAVVIPAIPGPRAVRIGSRDAATLHQLRGDRLVSVTAVHRYGLDLDGDGRADLAILEGGCESPDNCGDRYEQLARRTGERWAPATTCESTVTCWAF